MSNLGGIRIHAGFLSFSITLTGHLKYFTCFDHSDCLQKDNNGNVHNGKI